MLRGPLIFLAGSIGVLVASLAVRLAFLADVVPVAWADEPQSLWAVEAAFLLRATEFVAAGATALACLAIVWAISARARGTARPAHRLPAD
jgi:hypothetical protein